MSPIFRSVAPVEAYVLEVLGNYGVLPNREVDTTPFNADTSRKPVMGRNLPDMFLPFRNDRFNWAWSVVNSLSRCFARRDLEILQWLNTHRQEAAQWTAWHNPGTTESCTDNHISDTSKAQMGQFL